MNTSPRQATPATRPLPAGARFLGPHTSPDPMTITLVLRRMGPAPTPAAWPQHPRWPRGEFGAHCGAAPADIERIRGHARTQGLVETGCEPHRRVLQFSGSVDALQRAFGVQLGRYQWPGLSGYVVGCDRPPTLPADVAPTVIAVLGLDNRPVAKPQFRRPLATPNQSYTPLQIGQLYNFPANTDGSGECVALIELGGGFSQADLTTYFTGLGIASPPTVTAVPVAGGKNSPGGDADAEVMLDIEVVGALAPGAAIAVYFTPNTDQGFYEAISQAAHDTTRKPSVISISWGGPEDNWSAAALAAMQSALEDAAALGVSVTVAAGDSGSSDGESDGQPHVDFPASSPYSLACGGTTLTASASAIGSEVVWNETASNEGATGGGVSTNYALPAWQQGSKVPQAANGFAGRGVPDVAGDADPLTGYQVRVDGQDQVIGGTSAVAPLWAALLARCNQSLGRAVGDVHAALYQIGESAFHDITRGDNGAYAAGTGWDACTGLGSPDGQKLLAALAAQATAAAGKGAAAKHPQA
ncbi:S53 family serine peptidase [Rhodanobacter sp. DHB23]|uniref:S53 family peptidase n=1 Tax=Rhodanobacter sp. DHB23 TaxID=2775923 RepID=UPI001786BC4E|nr:S53 family serine peptidase [Rhodanobacter sp. DHB23]MBD8874305.1 peptidase S53 [Rhodanobacter sp. DHB23]